MSNTITITRGRLNKTTVIEIICVDHKNDTVVIRCWKPSARTARIELYEAQKMMEIWHGSLFPKEEAIRVDAKGQMSRSHRCPCGNDRTVSRSLTSIKANTTQPNWLE